MAKARILKSGETNINSNEIWRFAMHSDYKCQKLGSSGSTNLVMPALSGYASGSIYHNFGYIPPFFCFVEHSGKGYEVIGNANPVIRLKSANFFSYFSSGDYITNRDSVVGGVGGVINHNLTGGDSVRFKKNPSNSALPGGVNEGQTYYYHSNFSSSSFYMSTTPGGGILDFSTGSGADKDYWAKMNDFSQNETFFVDSVVFIDADEYKLNIEIFTADLINRPNFDEETFTIRAFFILDEII